MPPLYLRPVHQKMMLTFGEVNILISLLDVKRVCGRYLLLSGHLTPFRTSSKLFRWLLSNSLNLTQ